MFLQGLIENDECFETEKIQEPCLVSGQRDAKLMDAFTEKIGIRPRQRRPGLLQQFEEMQDLDLMGGLAGFQELRRGAGPEIRVTKKNAPFLVHDKNITPSIVLPIIYTIGTFFYERIRK